MDSQPQNPEFKNPEKFHPGGRGSFLLNFK